MSRNLAPILIDALSAVSVIFPGIVGQITHLSGQSVDSNLWETRRSLVLLQRDGSFEWGVHPKTISQPGGLTGTDVEVRSIGRCGTK